MIRAFEHTDRGTQRVLVRRGFVFRLGVGWCSNHGRLTVLPFVLSSPDAYTWVYGYVHPKGWL